MKVRQVLQPHWLTYINLLPPIVVACFLVIVVDYASALRQSPAQSQTNTQPHSMQELAQTQLQRTEVKYAESESTSLTTEIDIDPVLAVNYNVSNSNNHNNNVDGNETWSQQQAKESKEQQKTQQQLQQTQQQQQQPQQQSQQHSKQQQPQQQIQESPQMQIFLKEIVQSDNEPIAAPRVARRLEATNDDTLTQRIDQPYDVPLINKKNNVATASAKQRQRVASSRSNSRDSRKSAIAPTARETTTTATIQHASSFDSQAQYGARRPATTTTGRARNANANKSSRQQTRRVDGQGDRPNTQKSLSSLAQAVDTGSRRSANKSKTKSAPATTTTTSTTVSPLENFNPFSFLSPALWALSSPPKPESNKKPPKKYAPTTVATTTAPTKEKKKLKATARSATTTARTTKGTTEKAIITTTIIRATTTTKAAKARTTPLPTSQPTSTTTEGPFRIALPTFNFFGTQQQKSNVANSEKDKRNTVQNLRTQFECPRENEVRFQLFPKICKVDKDCAVWNRNELCCDIFGAKSCVSGNAKPLEETSHAPILGLIPRKCPSRPLAELWWQVQECKTDMDCWPRVCCPDGNKRYCRTSQPELETVPVPVQRSFNYLTEYLECTPPPPPIFDLHPKTCESTLDCFPNVCCQEAGLRHCRPPKKSLLTWMANILNVDFVKRLAQNIVIK